MSAFDIGNAATMPVDVRDALDAIKQLGPNANPLDLSDPVRKLAGAARVLNELDAEAVRLAALGILNVECGLVKAYADHFLKQAWKEAAGPEKAAKAAEKERQALHKAAKKMAGAGGLAGLDDPPVAEDPRAASCSSRSSSRSRSDSSWCQRRRSGRWRSGHWRPTCTTPSRCFRTAPSPRR